MFIVTQFVELIDYPFVVDQRKEAVVGASGGNGSLAPFLVGRRMVILPVSNVQELCQKTVIGTRSRKGKCNSRQLLPSLRLVPGSRACPQALLGFRGELEQPFSVVGRGKR